MAAAVIRARARGRFFNLVDLVNQLEQEKAAGRSGRLSEKLLRHDLIVIDELGYLPFSQSGAQLLFHLISKLYENTSLLSPDASLRHHRNRQRQLALQEPRITSRSPLAVRQNRLCSAV